MAAGALSATTIPLHLHYRPDEAYGEQDAHRNDEQ